MIDQKEIDTLELNEFNELYDQMIIDYIYGNHVAGHIKYNEKEYLIDIFFKNDKTISTKNAYKIIKTNKINFIKTLSGRFQAEYFNPVQIKITL
jgi:hypothetical protein